jgi:hypothetical protein
MAGGKRSKDKSPSAPQATDASAIETTTTPTKRPKRDASNNDQPIINDNGNTASASASIAADTESSTKASANMVIEGAAVEAPADITIVQQIPIEEQLAVSTYQISMFLTLFLCYSIFHRVHCVFFKI